jgi:ADP-ribose pyrophosphatase YjhB (NUDIX family)
VWVDRSEPVKRVLLRIWSAAPLPRRVRGALYWLLGSKYNVGVAALIFDPAGRVLLLRHTYKGRYPWGLPGGGLSRGEDTVAAIVREVREEAGLRISVVRLLTVEAHPQRMLVEIFYLCRSHGGQFRPNAEIAGYDYFDLAHLPPGVEPRVIHILKRYEEMGDLC